MELTEFYQILQSLELPLAYHHFEEGHSPKPPFLIYMAVGSDNLAADNWAYHKVLLLQVELYTTKKDTQIEQKVESLFDSHRFFFDKVEHFLDSEKLYHITYHMTRIGG